MLTPLPLTGVYVAAALVYSLRPSEVLYPQCLCWCERTHMRFSCVKCWSCAMRLAHSNSAGQAHIVSLERWVRGGKRVGVRKCII
jgi:hypothetical protein